MESKEEVISKVYYDQAGHGSMKKTYKHANKRNLSADGSLGTSSLARIL